MPIKVGSTCIVDKGKESRGSSAMLKAKWFQRRFQSDFWGNTTEELYIEEEESSLEIHTAERDTANRGKLLLGEQKRTFGRDVTGAKLPKGGNLLAPTKHVALQFLSFSTSKAKSKRLKVLYPSLEWKDSNISKGLYVRTCSWRSWEAGEAGQVKEHGSQATLNFMTL